MFRLSSLLGALTVVTVASASESAQAVPARRTNQLPRAYGDINFAVSQPLGAFNDFIGEGYGLTGGFVWNVDRDRVFGIRAEAGFVQYGNERVSGHIVNDRVPVDVSTSNDIVFAGIGPQISVPAGFFRPYLNATAGLSYFYTHSSINSDYGYEQDYDHTNHDDAVFALTGGGGFLIPLSMRRTPVLLDLGATFHRNGEATYLRKGSIQDNPDGSITINPIRSEANFITYRIGVSIGIPTR
jgi:hypothetical protein